MPVTSAQITAVQVVIDGSNNLKYLLVMSPRGCRDCNLSVTGRASCLHQDRVRAAIVMAGTDISTVLSGSSR